MKHNIAKIPKYKTPITFPLQHPSLPKIFEKEHFLRILEHYEEIHFGGKYDFLLKNIAWIRANYQELVAEVGEIESIFDNDITRTTDEMKIIKQKIAILEQPQIRATQDEITAMQKEYQTKKDILSQEKQLWFQDIEQITQKIILAERENESKRLLDKLDGMPEFIRNAIESGTYSDTVLSEYRVRQLAYDFMKECI